MSEDSLKMMKRLEQAGWPHDQAVGLARVVYAVNQSRKGAHNDILEEWMILVLRNHGFTEEQAKVLAEEIGRMMLS